MSQAVTVAGRHPDSTVYLDDATVSRYHAEFRWLDDEYWLIDTGSLNGTYVNGELVQSLPLADADEIQIGKFRLTFTCQPRTERSTQRGGAWPCITVMVLSDRAEWLASTVIAATPRHAETAPTSSHQHRSQLMLHRTILWISIATSSPAGSLFGSRIGLSC
jgi:pSer/pThr/pTyr-binding forkhead associated (FHA) protein